MKKAQRIKRDHEIYVLWQLGLSMAEIARAKQLTPRHVSRILRQEQEQREGRS